jgi:hypothetical protein
MAWRRRRRSDAGEAVRRQGQGRPMEGFAGHCCEARAGLGRPHGALAAAAIGDKAAQSESGWRPLGCP